MKRAHLRHEATWQTSQSEDDCDSALSRLIWAMRSMQYYFGWAGEGGYYKYERRELLVARRGLEDARLWIVKARARLEQAHEESSRPDAPKRTSAEIRRVRRAIDGMEEMVEMAVFGWNATAQPESRYIRLVRTPDDVERDKVRLETLLEMLDELPIPESLMVDVPLRNEYSKPEKVNLKKRVLDVVRQWDENY